MLIVPRDSSRRLFDPAVSLGLPAHMHFKGGEASFAGALILATLAAVLAVLVFFSAPASALNTHEFSTSFGSPGSGAGELEGPQGVAVSDATGDVYVADTGNARVDQFESDGAFVRAWGWGVADGISDKFQTCTLTCFKGLSGSGAGQFTTPVFVAVDNSTGPSKGDVYVADTGDNLVTKFTAAGALVSSWGDTSPTPNGQLAGRETAAGSFGSVAGVAVGPTGVLYVFNTANQVFELEQNGTFSPPEVTAGERGTEQKGFAVDSLGDLFKVNGDASVEKFTGSGGDLGQVTLNEEHGRLATAVATDGTDLYVSEAGSVDHYAFNGAGEVSEAGGSTCATFEPEVGCPPTDSFGSSESSGGALAGGSAVGVDTSSGEVYVADATAGRIDVFAPIVLPDVATEAAGEIRPSSATLNGTVDPDGVNVTDCRFDYVAAAEYNASAADPYEAGRTAACEQTVGAGTGEVAVTAKLAGLAVGTAYDFRLQAGNANGANYGANATFSTLPKPAITGAAVSHLSATSVDPGAHATSVDLEAQVNPGGLPLHSCVFEYGAEAGVYSKHLACTPAQIGSGTSPVSVSAHLEGLEANTEYHWRVVASSEAGATTSSDHTFILDTTSGAGLPDGRAYEMVTPPQKNAAVIGDVFLGSPPDIAASGSRVIASSIQCFAGAESCTGTRESEGEPFLFTRTAGGWVTTALAPPATQFEANTRLLLSAEAGTALFSMPTPPSSEDDFYVRQGDGSFLRIGPTTSPALGPQGVPFDGVTMEATGDFSRIVYQLQGEENLWPSINTGNPRTDAVYEFRGAGESNPLPVGLSGGPGSEPVSKCGTELGADKSTVQPGELSADGETVYFTADACEASENGGREVPANAVYARIGDERTVAVSQPECGAGTAPSEEACRNAPASPALFEGASVDGSKAFFLSTQQLTANAGEDADMGDRAVGTGCSETSGENGCNLYEYDFADPAGHNLIDVSAGDSSGAGPRVQGAIAISADGSHIYFVAKGVLASAANGEGETAQDGAENLYVFERDTAFPQGHVAFIAQLPASDRNEWVGGPGEANVTPEGRFLVFTSGGELTADDTRTDGAQQVFRYDAQTEKLTRISIGQHGFNDNGNGSSGRTCRLFYACPDNAGIVPATLGFDHAGPSRSDPTMADDGAYVFFESPVGLTPQALNNVQIGTSLRQIGPGEPGPLYAQNVYEWHAGHLSLISDGRDTSKIGAKSTVGLLGSDATGANVFFTTADPLVPQDTDTQLDIYDAHICSASEPCIAPPPAALAACQGESCHGTPPATPSLLAPASVTFNGRGNVASAPAVEARSLRRARKLANALKACKRKPKKQRAACEKRARRKYAGAIKTRKSSHHRGAKR